MRTPQAMTPKEHELMIYMFAVQAMLIKTLANILQSKDYLSDEDLEPFNNANFALESLEPRVSETLLRTYVEAARKLGLDVPVKGL